jgi:hypothetical protein
MSSRPVFLLDPDDCEEARPFVAQERPLRLLKTEEDLAKAFRGKTAALFVVVHADPLFTWLAGSRRHFRRHRLLVLDQLQRSRSEVLRGMFTSVVVPDTVWKMLPREELAEAVSAPNAPDLIIGGVVDEGGDVIRFIKGDLESLVVPVSTFKAPPGGPEPNLAAMEFTDYGQTVKFGEFEAATDAILHEHDRDFRRRARARLRAEDRSLGGAIRRLRIQRGLSRAGFPGLSSKEIARIERGQITKPQRATLRTIADALSVRVEELKEH